MGSSADDNRLHGQPPSARRDWFFNAPLSFFFGLCILAAGCWCAVGIKLTESQVEVVLMTVILIIVGFSLLVLSLSHRLRLAVRIGAWPAANPTTLEQITELLRGSSPPVVVGEGWSFFIGRRSPGSKVLSLGAKWSGVTSSSENSVRVRSGAVFGEMVQEFWKLGRALADRPQFDQLSVGGAVRTCGHGWHGAGWFIDSVIALQGVERGSGQVVEAHRGDDLFWKLAFGENWVITEVEVASPSNRMVRVQQRVQKLERDPHSGFDQYLADQIEPDWHASAFRLMFVSSNQVIRKWANYVADDSVEEANVSGCDLRCRTLRRHLRLPIEIDQFDSTADVHTLIQTIWPLESLIERIAGTINVELFVARSFDWDAVVPPLAKFHRKQGGRTELRDRVVNGVAVSALDVILPMGPACFPCCSSEAALQEWFAFLHADLDVTEGSLHAGKYIPKETGPVKVMSPAEFWPSVSTTAAGTTLASTFANGAC
mmetsp:Transcript_62282/g.157388  ORF Transcript_62282/g.157388 Transcript_62282/m.157388 type:complete len:486 (+) Transcript_62282:70-1527(+)